MAKLDGGRVQVKRAGRRLVLDLSRDITGCTGRLYDLSERQQYEGRVDFEVVDQTEKAPYTYVLLLASAPPNCNVQGHCGAGDPDATLLWLKFREDLALAGKQSFAITECRANRFAMITPEDEINYQIRAKDLPWVEDVLRIEFEEEDSVGYVIYDRRNPGAGLQGLPLGSGPRTSTSRRPEAQLRAAS